MKPTARVQMQLVFCTVAYNQTLMQSWAVLSYNTRAEQCVYADAYILTRYGSADSCASTSARCERLRFSRMARLWCGIAGGLQERCSGIARTSRSITGSATMSESKSASTAAKACCGLLIPTRESLPSLVGSNTRHLLSDYQEDKESMGTSYTFLPRLALQRWDESDIQTGADFAPCHHRAPSKTHPIHARD